MTAIDGGFAAVLELGQATLEDLIRANHVANRLPHKLATTFDVTGTSVTVDLFVDSPKVTLAAANSGKVELGLDCWGPLTVAIAGGPTDRRLARLRVRIRALPELDVKPAKDGPKLSFRLSTVDLEVDGLSVESLAGGAFSPAVSAFLTGGDFSRAVYVAILGQLAKLSTTIPLTSAGGNLASGVFSMPDATATLGVLDGVFAVGIDATLPSGATSGAAAGLIDFRDGANAAIVIAPAALSAALEFIRTPIENQVAASGANLDEFSVTVVEGALHVSGTASESDASVHFAFDGIPRYVRPARHEEGDDEYGGHWVIDSPARHEFWLDVINVSVDVDRPWWSYLLEATFAMVTVPLAEGIFGLVTDATALVLSKSGAAPAAPLVQLVPIVGTGRSMTLELVEVRCHPDDLLVRLTVTVDRRNASIAGASPDAIWPNDLPSALYQLRALLPDEAHPQDPQVFLRWTCRRGDGTLLAARDDAGSSLVPFTLDLRGPPTNESAAYSIECRIYRTLGPTVTDLASPSASIRVYDRLDRTKPFVRWAHDVYTPDVAIETDGTHVRKGLQEHHRRSAIHKTKIPGRCLMVARFSKKIDAYGVPDAPQLEYLEALPFPIDEIVAFRAVLCDYCFFGGPDKPAPLPL